jgi:hypothetical protein
MRFLRRWRRGLVLALAATTLAGCGGGASGGTPTDGAHLTL